MLRGPSFAVDVLTRPGNRGLVWRCDRHRCCSQAVSPQTGLVAPRELPLWGCKRTSFRCGGTSEKCRFCCKSLLKVVIRLNTLHVTDVAFAILVPEPPAVRKGASGTFYDKGLEG